MAQKRMFDKRVIDSDNFLEMPLTTQAVYFHLNMRADDDGFVDNYKSILRLIGGKDDDLKVLISKSFVIPFEKGVIVIKHWKLNNFLRKDRYTETIHQEEKGLLTTGENGEYFIGTPLVNQRSTQNSIGENSIVENSKDKSSRDINTTPIQNINPSEEILKEEPLENNLFVFLENAWGRTLSSFEYELLSNWKDDEITRYAIKESVKCNARSIKYVERIVENLKAKGIKTEAEAIIESDNFKSKRNKKTNSTQRETLADKLKRLKEEAKIHDEVEARR